MLNCSFAIRRRRWHPTPVLLPGKSHGWRGLVGYSPWGREESDTTERLHFHFSLLCIGEGNDNPLQCSCLEKPRDGGAWRAAVYGVAQSRTRRRRRSSSMPHSLSPVETLSSGSLFLALPTLVTEFGARLCPVPPRSWGHHPQVGRPWPGTGLPGGSAALAPEPLLL